MFITVSELQSDWNLSVNGVLHIGAHTGEEADQYENSSWTPVIWIEAQPDLARDLRQKLNPDLHTVIEATIFDKNDIELSMNISSNSQSSSLLNFGTHKMDYPEITVTNNLTIKTKRIDALIDKKSMPNFINLDIQGVELKALKSLGNLISKVSVIYTEVNKRQVYKECDLIEDIDQFLASYGFRRVSTRWVIGAGWGDALYLSKKVKRRSFMQFLRSQVQTCKFYVPQIKSKLKSKTRFVMKNFNQNNH